MAEVSTDKSPPGNWIAHHLRLMNNNSRKVFPSTAGSKRSYRKYDSLYMVDFEDFPEGALSARLEDKLNLEEIQKQRPTIADVLFCSETREQGKMFSSWTIPERIIDKESPKQRRRITKTRKPSPDNSPDSLPEIRRMTPGQSIPSPTVGSRLPKMASKSAKPKPVARSAPVTPLPRAKSVGAHEADRLKEELRASFKPGAVNMAEDWMKSAPNGEREVIEKILSMQEQNQQVDHALKKTLLPDARHSVQKWLDKANENERQVALKFFTSVAGSKLVGTTAEEQRARLQQVISTLQRQKGRGTPRPSDRPMDPRREGTNLKYVQLLTPNTRAHRWQHATWHHLPEYRERDPVNNWSSHYTRPHAAIPRHFVIHPDWG